MFTHCANYKVQCTDTDDDVCWCVAHGEGQLHLVGIEGRNHTLHERLLAGTLWEEGSNTAAINQDG